MEKFKLDESIKKIQSKKNVYISLVSKNYGVEPETAENIFVSELEAFSERMKTYFNSEYVKNKNNTPTLSELQGTNIFLEVMQMGLSFAPAAGLVYVSRLKGTGTAVGYQITAKGEIYLAQRSGAIDYISDPVIVINSEEFQIKSNPDGTKYVDHTINFDRKESIEFLKDYKCGYVFITFPNGDKDLRWVDFSRMKKSYDMSPGKKNYNDISFLQTKVILRALRNIRKVPFLMSMAGMPDDVVELDSEQENNQNEDVSNTLEQQPSTPKSYPNPVEPEVLQRDDLTDGLSLDFDF